MPQSLEKITDDFKNHLFPFQLFLISFSPNNYDGDLMFIDFPNLLITFTKKGTKTSAIHFQEILKVSAENEKFTLLKKDKSSFVFYCLFNQEALIQLFLDFLVCFSKQLKLKFEAEQFYAEPKSEVTFKVGTVSLNSLHNKLLASFKMLSNDSYIPTGNIVNVNMEINKKKRKLILGISFMLLCEFYIKKRR